MLILERYKRRLRAMKSDEERINFVLRFAEMDLQHLRVGAWGDFKEDLVLRFLDWPSWRQDEVSLEVLEPLQKEIREQVFSQIARENRYAAHPEEIVPERRMQELQQYQGTDLDIGMSGDHAWLKFPVVGSMIVRLGIEDFRPTLNNAPLRESFLFALAITLSKLDIKRLQRCPFCTRLFYAEHGRQEYCSARCSNLTRTKRLRDARATQKEEHSLGYQDMPTLGSVSSVHWMTKEEESLGSQDVRATPKRGRSLRKRTSKPGRKNAKVGTRRNTTITN